MDYPNLYIFQNYITIPLSEVVPSVKCVCWIKIVNKTSFDHGATQRVSKYMAPPGVGPVFYNNLFQRKLTLLGSLSTTARWSEVREQ